LHNELGVPVGVIDASWGGTPAEAWAGYEALRGVDGFEGELAALERSGFTDRGLQADYERRLDRWLAKLEETDLKFDRGEYQTGDEWGTMPVPGLWETSVLPDFDGVVWMQRKLRLPAEAVGKPVELHLGVIDNEDVTYFNGKKVGGMSGWNVPRVYHIPAGVAGEENVITVRVIDFDGGGGIGGAPQSVCAIVDGKTYTLAGDWNYLVAGDVRSLPQRPSEVGSQNYPTVLYNAMIHPLRVMPLKGVLWYQGCANVGRDRQYEPLFKALISDWRNLWESELPFYFVQLAGFQTPKNVQPESAWAYLRNAQAKALELPNTAMAVATDLGNPADIHPADKQEVARRLALIALNRDYGKPCEYASPECVSATSSGGKFILKFNGALKPASAALTGFILGDGNGNFAYANACLAGDDTVVLSSPLVIAPVVARYNWADYPGGNLYGANGLPVAPFATDE
ncbi:MAG: 9-O-acetylesterase, partial [Muribaculaceae bacterium]|nr:9-O-acetylesterase [Muribaculaceae bacterium]